MEYLKLSWEEIEEFCMELARRIKRDNLKFDYILAISRGGLIPGRLLSDYLDIDILVARIKFYTSIGKTSEKPVIEYFPENVSGLRILVVDDIADTGESLLVTVNELRKRGALFYRIATLLMKPWSKIKPDYYVKVTDKWVIFPWEKIETIRNIKSKKRNEEEFFKEVKRAGLIEYINLDIL